MCRAIKEIQPRWVVGENVFGIVNWSDGLVFQEVQAELEAQGYEVQPFVLPASAVNAPHRRDRVWFVADTSHSGLQRGEINGSIGGGRAKSDEQPTRCVQPSWENFPTQSPVCGRNDGIPTGLDGITFPKWRNESIKAYGNAVVPQVVYQIFKAIAEYDRANYPDANNGAPPA
jgi:DNA (cytosine-5)-methyltransferase 1